MRHKVAALALAALATAGLTSVPSAPAGAEEVPRCFGQNVDVVSTKDRDTVILQKGRTVALIKGDYTKVAVGFDSDPPISPFSEHGLVLICVKRGADHVRVTGWVTRLYSGGEDTRLVYSGPCSHQPNKPMFYGVHQVTLHDCNDEVQGP